MFRAAGFSLRDSGGLNAVSVLTEPEDENGKCFSLRELGGAEELTTNLNIARAKARGSGNP